LTVVCQPAVGIGAEQYARVVGQPPVAHTPS
jgi:hypothetical protein